MSSNPFRKKTIEAIDTAKTRAPSPAKSSLRSSSPLVDGGRPKTVKKVRVLSPPPLSPDSPVWPTGVGDNGLRDPSTDGRAEDQAFNGSFTVAWPTVGNDDPVDPPPPPAVASSGSAAQATPPPNPFSKTLHDLMSSEELQSQRKSEGFALRVGNASRQSLNVDSFKRLLLTGNVNDAESPAAENHTGDGYGDGDGDDKSSSSTASLTDGGDELATPISAQQSTSRDKRAPPPPPSSRHGRSLKDSPVAGIKAASSSEGEATARTTGHEAGSVQEAEAEQLPESEPQHAPATQPSGRRKSAPAPPPRRGHSRTESRTAQPSASSSAEPSPLKVSVDETPTAISPVETPSRQSNRAPNPPPPRRPRLSTPTSPHGAQSSQPPSTPSRHHDTDQEHPSPTTAIDDAQPETPKPVGPPPPPPTRSHSIRRRPSAGSVESVSRRARGEPRPRDGAAPPPPPPRQRGSSVGSLDSSPRQGGVVEGASQAASAQEAATVDGAIDDSGGHETVPDTGKGSDILADLDALQREVDALRGTLG
ncbi:hypothetical protein XA68_10164 [Ophiocordyceps unilateralis]|uniref:Uncharacterized protein n=1 Tax=Ophiocordyceps unilateralis TaxID=268505 RepID=A0A2A9PJ21_OPHUN|nr:hypothetical protein XA68_10164 [Ophiocordyceps unilateralis]